MNPPNDPLVVFKASSPTDPIIPVFEHLTRQMDAIRNDAKSMARDAKLLLDTRTIIFLWACFISAGMSSAGTWFALRGHPSPDLQILHEAGVEIAITDTSNEVKLRFPPDSSTPLKIDYDDPPPEGTSGLELG